MFCAKDFGNSGGAAQNPSIPKKVKTPKRRLARPAARQNAGPKRRKQRIAI